MPQRIAACLSLIVFAVCVMAGIAAENPFGTVIVRALLAMMVTLVIGLVIGAMAQKMLDENIAAEKSAAQSEIPEAKANSQGR